MDSAAGPAWQRKDSGPWGPMMQPYSTIIASSSCWSGTTVALAQPSSASSSSAGTCTFAPAPACGSSGSG